MRSVRCQLVGATLVVCAGLLGCGGETVKAPPTQIIEGTVLQKNGKPFPGGMIEFRDSKNVGVMTMGVVGPDGGFTVKTISGNRQSSEGIPEGEYNVTVTPVPDAKGQTLPITLSKPFQIKAGDTKITVTLEK